MAGTRQLTARQRDVLAAIVENYIATGEPVSSAAVADSRLVISSAASPATIRNEMAALVEAGLLEQPHTSAGRIPSAAAFRVYVEQILKSGTRLPQSSRSEMESRINLSLAGAADAGAEALLERTSQVLAALSSGVGVAVGAEPAHDLLEHVHFSRIADRRVLAVLVTRNGLVRDRVLHLEEDVSAAQLEVASNFLNQHFRGWSLESVRTELSRRVEQERSAYREMIAAAQQLWARAMPERVMPPVFVEGVANLAGMPESRERLREMLSALEAKQRLMDLLNAYIDARQETVRVVFDLDRAAPEMAGLVLVAAPARVAGDRLATIGVIGPKRMHYENTMNAVGYVAGLFDRVLDLARSDPH